MPKKTGRDEGPGKGGGRGDGSGSGWRGELQARKLGEQEAWNARAQMQDSNRAARESAPSQRRRILQGGHGWTRSWTPCNGSSIVVRSVCRTLFLHVRMKIGEKVNSTVHFEARAPSAGECQHFVQV